MRGLLARQFGPTVKAVCRNIAFYLQLFIAGRAHACGGKLP